MNQSIYTERENILPHHAEWLDGCGARSYLGNTLLEMFKNNPYISYTNYFENRWILYDGNDERMAYILTGSEFCEKIAEILKIQKPTFDKKVIMGNGAYTQKEINNLIDNESPTFAEVAEALKTDAKDIPFNFPHRTYKIFISLDDIPNDKRILSDEWLPPFSGEKDNWILLINAEQYEKVKLISTDWQGLLWARPNGTKFYTWTDVYWMKIV